MAKEKLDPHAFTIPAEVIMNKIYLIRGCKVMFDRDLAELYGVETRVLNQAVRRNDDRFPSDFMFQLTKEEMENWISQFVISNSVKMGLRKPPLVFTEQGIAMLSSVLNSKRAVQMNILIIRTFIKIREMIMTHTDLLLKFERVEKQLGKQDKNIRVLFDYLNQFIQEQQKPRELIGFKRKQSDKQA